jgi:hypothetical protein
VLGAAPASMAATSEPALERVASLSDALRMLS